MVLMDFVTRLPEDHKLYFLSDPRAVFVPVGQLEPSKPPETQRESVDRAEELMRHAAAGEVGRRAPISVARAVNGYKIIDGNATYGVALRHGWQALPAVIMEEADA